jgi:hypothetical protein
MGLFTRSTTTAPVAAAPAAAFFDAGTSAVDDLTGDYTLDVTHTRIGFSARHAMVTTVRGQFTEFEGSAHLDTANPSASSAKVNISAASISTGQADRDGHRDLPFRFRCRSPMAGVGIALPATNQWTVRHRVRAMPRRNRGRGGARHRRSRTPLP